MNIPVEVPRDPDAMIDRAALANYRPAVNYGYNCFFCASKQAVPWMWCDEVGRQVEIRHTCDKWRGGAADGID